MPAGLNFAQIHVKGDREITHLPMILVPRSSNGINRSFNYWESFPSKQKRNMNLMPRGLVRTMLTAKAQSVRLTVRTAIFEFRMAQLRGGHHNFTISWWSGGEKTDSFGSIFIGVSSDIIDTSEGYRRCSPREEDMVDHRHEDGNFTKTEIGAWLRLNSERFLAI